MNADPTTSSFTGLGVALATPFTTGTESTAKHPDGGGTGKRGPRVELDLAAYERLVRHVLAGGADWLLVLGSTGEAATVTDIERATLVQATRALAGPVPVVVGVGHHSTERTVELAQEAVAGGADGLLVVTPYYNRPQRAGLVAHYAAVAEAVPGVPVIAYNVPARTGSNLTPEVLQRLWAVPGLLAIKESSGDLRQIARACREAPPGRFVLAGDDDLALPAIAVGARGLVSVCGNVAPAHAADLVSAALADDWDRARAVAAQLAPLVTALFTETNPVPVKAALACLGLATGMVRPPLAPADPATWALVQAALSDLGLGRVPTPPLEVAV